jgi:transcriptional antiterminator NusG
MKGTVEEVNLARGKVRVTVNIFGRPTPLELDFTEAEKLS